MIPKNSDAQKVSWSEIESLVKIVAEKISKIPRNFTSISTITRGGLVPARLLSDQLGIDIILVDKKKIPLDSIFVDDIFDSGKTFKKILNRIDSPSDLVFVTLFARRGKKYPKQLLFGKKTNSSSYIVYPWEKLEYKRLKNYSL